MAIIFDIRRGNMIEHLMYKALFETSADRAEFLSKLFSRPRPAGLDTSRRRSSCSRPTSPATPDSMLYSRNLAAITTADEGLARLRDGRQRRQVARVHLLAFYDGGPQINYNYLERRRRRVRRGNMPTYATLQVATDTAGKNWAYLATEANYRWLKDFETKNLLVPVVGDFAGPKAIRAVAQYLKDHHAIVGAFYTSNVEQYLFQQDDEWKRYYTNVATLPLDSDQHVHPFDRRRVPRRRRTPRASPAADAARRTLPSVTCVEFRICSRRSTTERFRGTAT